MTPPCMVNRGGYTTVVVALLTVVCAHEQTCGDKVAPAGDDVSFLQTFHKVKDDRSKKRRDVAIEKTEATNDEASLLKVRHHADKEAVIGDDVSLFETSSAVLAFANPARAALMQKSEVVRPKEGSDCIVWMPIDLRILHMSLSVVGLNPPDETCDPGDPMFGMMDFVLAQVSASRLGQSGIFNFEVEDTYYLLLPMTYCLLMTFFLGRMLWYIVTPVVPATKKLISKPRSRRRPEAESWERGYMNWLFVDWVSEWIAKWGNVEDSDSTKITADDLDELGDPEDEVDVCYNKIKKIWEEEVERVGLQQASILLVITRFIGWYKILGITLWSSFYETCMFLGPPISMAWVIRYIEWLYVARLQGQDISWKALMPATVVTICLFQGLPAFIAISNSISTMLGMRMSIRVCGGLSSLVFKKAQRLPLGSLDVDENSAATKIMSREELRKEKLSNQRRKALEVKDAEKKEARPDQDQSEHSEDSSDEETSSEADKKAGGDEKEQKERADSVDEEEHVVGEDDDETMRAPARFNLVQLVANDINTNVVNVPLAICRLFVMLPICGILFVMLWGKIKLTLVACAISSGIVTYSLWCTAVKLVTHITEFYYHAGRRLQFVEDMLFNIRTVKAFGWEGIIQEKIYQLRSEELEVLWKFYKTLGVYYGIFYQFPRVMILISLWGYNWFYGSEKPVNIFATLPILFTFQSAIMSMMMTAPMIFNAKPSLTRLEQFMKLPEAPLPRQDKSPPWVHTWAGAGVEGKVTSMSIPRAPGRAAEVRAPVARALQIQGSFKWRGMKDAVLKDLNLYVPAGSSLAILGKVGSGKSSLLNAMIGELYPVGDSRISIPSQIAYSGQTPYICEGTLRENILYGEPYNESRYNTCVFASSLIPDLQVLPGGDEVPIGSRGISLSGGQRARVSMARAAYCQTAEVVLIDDPFGAVDSRTARHLLDEYVHGQILAGRTKIVVCQPDPERIKEFDKIVIVHKGRIVVEGTPREIKMTREYNRLLNRHQQETLAASSDTAGQRHKSGHVRPPKSKVEAFQLREDECESRPDWQTISYFLSMGGWYLILSCVALFLVMMVFQLMMNVVLQNWASDNTLAKAGMMYPMPAPSTYLWPFIAWWSATIVVWVGCWTCGMHFTINLSKKANLDTVKAIVHAPVDRFFDRTPVGRIMNRMSTDLINIDVNTYNHITQLIAVVWTHGVPLVYLHILMPVYFTCACIPFYYLMFLLVRRFWNTMVPMRYLVHVSKSYTDTTLTEVDNSNAFVRACRKGDYRFAEFQRLMKNQIKADVTTQTFLKRWLVNRLFLMMGFFVCGMVLIAIWVPNSIAIGGIGLCLANMFSMIVAIEDDIDKAMKAQFQVISMKRLHDYTVLEQEADYEKDSDISFRSYCVKIPRRKLGTLERQNSEGGLVIVKKRSGYDQLLLEQADQNLLMAPQGFHLLDPANADLKVCNAGHRIVAVNGKGGGSSFSIEPMVTELVSGQSTDIVLQIHSGWLLKGAHLTITDLVAGYGDIVPRVLKEVSIEIFPRSKVGVVGTTGCGKSTLLLCILRILEPKGGSICLNGVDTKTLGLKTLRRTVGMVAQDPVLMQCSIRDNLDPFNEFDDEMLWKGLDMVRMKDHIESLEGRLGFDVKGDGGNLSFGQRQLICLARMVIRQPKLMLLDEATSALDPATQQQVQHTVERHFPNSTLLMIAHRLETIVNFDKVVVMEKGKIAEQGSPTELRDKEGGKFAEMWHAKTTW